MFFLFCSLYFRYFFVHPLGVCSQYGYISCFVSLLGRLMFPSFCRMGTLGNARGCTIIMTVEFCFFPSRNFVCKAY
ncbi:hypothetical protein HOY82DRAFT_547609 [Tuber indicum]|nr:hypothetical protein HOY82DRAFT_547609 [Tuber indicum]